MTNIELKNVLDENKDGKIDKKDLTQLKKSIDKLGINVELKALEDSAIDNAIKTKDFIPNNFREDILKINNKEEKKMLVFLFQFGEKILGQESLNELAKDIPLNEVVLFLSEIIEVEKGKDLVQTATIVLTLDEINHLSQKIFADYTKEKLQKFVKEQLNENISSSEAIKGTKFAKTLEKAGKDPVKYMKNIDKLSTIFLTAISSENGKDNISKDTLHNMGTGLSIAFFQLFSKNKDKLNFNFDTLQKAIEIEAGTDDGKNIAVNFIKSVNRIVNIIQENFDKEGLDKSENNDILMNPVKFSKFIMNVYKNNLDKGDILSKLKENQNTKHAEYDKKEVIKDIQKIFNSKDFENIKKEDIEKTESLEKTGNALNQLKGGLEEIKKEGHKWVENNMETLKTVKEVTESLGIWETIKKIISKILKWLGFENGWNDIEDKLETNTSLDKYVIDYLKNKTNIDNIKKNKDSIFYKGFEKNLKENSKEEISGTKVVGNISGKTMYYLSSLGTDKDNINNNLDTFFKTDNFKKVIKKANIKEEDFYKKVFSTKKEKNNEGIETNVGIINMEELSKVIEKAYEKEIAERFKDKKEVLESIHLKTGVPKDVIFAIWSNESSLKKAGSTVTRFENHIYNKYVGQYGKKKAKMLATSYGVFQIMGFNYKQAGYNSVEEFVKAQNTADGQIHAFINFVNNNPKLKKAMINRNWAEIAKIYNGPKYKQNNYDTKLALASNKYTNIA